jgi:hypothetical protein
MKINGNINELILSYNKICAEIFRLTSDTVLSYDKNMLDSEADVFSELYDKREGLVAELAQIYDEIGEKGVLAVKNMGGELACVHAESEDFIRKTIELDSRNRAFGGEMMDAARDHIRRINKGRATSLKYESKKDSGGYLVDSKN